MELPDENEPLPPETRRFDLEERTAKFGEAVIEYLRSIPKDVITSPLLSQTVRSATSIGANYAEACSAVSKKDFKLKIGISCKEARETMHWLRMLAKAHPPEADQSRILWKEARELLLIFSAIFRK